MTLRQFIKENEELVLVKEKNKELLLACKEVHKLMAYPALSQSVFNRIRDILKQAIAKAEGSK